jgi:aldose sugar dehydrogenase
MHIRSIAAAALCATALTAVPALAQVDEVVETELGAVQVTTFASGLTNPWGLAFLPEGGMLVTERPGDLRFVSDDGDVSDAIAGVPEVDARGQGGLLDVELDPDFASNRLVYMSFAEPGDEAGTNSTAVARGVLNEDLTELSEVEVIFSQQPKLPSQQHYGSRIVFDDDGYLFITTGERSDAEFRVQAQDLDSHLGKVIRIMPDGSVPEDNPFVDTEGALAEIYTYGHRNNQGAAIHPETGRFWVNEHGPRGGDELNLIEAGLNYGWPEATYGVEYSGEEIMAGDDFPSEFQEPVEFWDPSPAFSGLVFYTGDEFPEWQGHALMGALAGTSLVRVELEDETVVADEFMFTDLGLRIRDVRQAPDGSVFLLTDEEDGEILRLSAG